MRTMLKDIWLLLSLLGLCIIFTIIETLGLWFYLDADTHTYTIWFPNYYWAAIILLRAPILFVVSFALYRLSFIFSVNKILSALIASIFISVILYAYHIKIIRVFTIWGLLIFVSLYISFLLASFITIYQNRLIPLIKRYNYLLNFVFLFVVYTLLSITLPKAYPFSPFTMFDSFPPTAEGYYIKCRNGDLFPVAKYSKTDACKIFDYNRAWMVIHPQLSSENDSIYLAKRGRAIFNFFLEKSVEVPDKDSLEIYMITFYLKNNSLAEKHVKIFPADE